MIGPLVDVAWLAAGVDDPSVRVVDTRWYLGEPGRGRLAYDEGHIPGAVYADLEEDLSADRGPGRHPLPDPATFARTLGRLGITTGTKVVAYDDRGGAVAARLWWMLRAIEHREAAVLDGGLDAWRALGHPVDDAPPQVPPASYEIAVSEYRGTVDRDTVLAALGEAVLLDARSVDRFRGETEPIDPVAGHIPTALNAPYEANLGPDGRFLPGEVLAGRYFALGVSTNADVVAYCGSGVTACHDILAMEVGGITGVKLYPGSWSDWSTSGLPAAIGDG